MGNLGDLAYLDAIAQAELVRKKEVQPIELVEAAIERIEKLNPKLNAVVTPMFDQARESANAELPDGSFTGVPLFWDKDNLPIGVLFMGRFGDEATLFRLASQLEASQPWAHRRPPVSA